MEKVREESIQIKRRFHASYCDCCEKFLGEDYEGEDGYYKDFGNPIDTKIGIDRIYGTLCDECRDALNSELEQTAKELADKYHISYKKSSY